MLNVRGLGFEQKPPQPFSLPMPIVYERVSEPPRWEYHSVTIDLREDEPLDERALNALGAEGWMLVSVAHPVGKSESARLIYYFMRPA
ncbi:MAG TPA: hypothetical protein VFQ25_11010 [Ktedonobacterales bacterium]|nr:hypothetical protein [Ktedonobacterales bacterium]